MKDVQGHECVFEEVKILSHEEGDVLRKGMKVLIPCAECGETPADELAFIQGLNDEFQKVLANHDPRRALFHWSPVERRKSILRYGLRPGSKNTTSSMRYMNICFADSPSWAWALSAEVCGERGSEWDLWQTALDQLHDPVILPGPDRSSGIYEIRTQERVFKSDLWYVGSRSIPLKGRKS